MEEKSIFAPLKAISRLWRDISRSSKGGETISFSPDLSESDERLLREQMKACLLSKGGEVSARGRAVALGREYLALNQTGRQRFLSLMTREFGPNMDEVAKAVTALQAATPDQYEECTRALRAALEPRRIKLLTQFNALPQGVKFLVDMRTDILRLKSKAPELAALDHDLKGLLAQWFDVGFLELRRIDWDTPAVVLEKIIQGESVHTINGWDDLKNRLDSDRRLYAFFQPRMKYDPLIFVEVALVNGMAANVGELLDISAPLGDVSQADTAIFYSINNAQRGLDGISFGNFLIKKVVEELRHEWPQLKTFATLSPVPGFVKWLETQGPLPEPIDENRDFITRACARYLTSTAQRGRSQSVPRALDAVAHFHLSNGARLERINWKADCSEKGRAQSLGVMVNYLYNLDQIENNHEAYVGQGQVVVSSAVKSLLKG